LTSARGAVDRQTPGGTLISSTTYTYDVFGNLIEEDVTTSSTVVTRFALDGWKSGGNVSAPSGNENWDVWATLDGNNNLLTRYIGGDAVDQHVARVVVSGANQGVAWYLTDWQGSTRNLIDSSGNLHPDVGINHPLYGHHPTGSGWAELIGTAAAANLLKLAKTTAMWRTAPMNLKEKLALEEAMAGAGEPRMGGLSDPRFLGMQKWQHVHYNADGSKIVIHYVRDPKTGALMGFKFID
jgi:hypothetical protein